MKIHSGFALLPMFAATLLAAQQTTRLPNTGKIKNATLPAPNSMTAYDPYFSEGRGYWERDYLVYVDPHVPRVDLYDKDKIQVSIKAAIPGYSDFHFHDGTVTPDGHVIVSGCSFADIGGEVHCFIGLANRDGHVSPLVDTGRFAPGRISTCDGATVWAMGWLRAPDFFGSESHKPYDVLRLYRLADGKIVTSALPRNSFPKRSHPSEPGGFQSPELTMQCRGTKLGLYEGASDEWIEYDAGDSKPTRWKLPKMSHRFAQYDSNGKMLPVPVRETFITGVAMLDSGDVYASFVHRNRQGLAPATVGLFRLQKAADHATWLLIDGTEGSYAEQGKFQALCGTDGKNLVYSRMGELHWFFSSPPH
jgi:hypothetical protein